MPPQRLRRRWLPVAMVAAAITIAVAPAPAPGQSAMTALSPDDFSFWRTGRGETGEWRVVDDPGATHVTVLAQLSRDRTDYRFPLVIYKPATALNADVAIRFKPVGGEVDQAGGVAIRLATPDDYYVVRANALEDNVRFYRVVKGRREQIAGADIKVASGVWHTLEIRAEGEHFTISFDGAQLFTANDKIFDQAGKVALWTKADGVTYFGTLTIHPLP